MHNLFINPPAIRARLIDVSDHQIGDFDSASDDGQAAVQNETISNPDQLLNRFKRFQPALRHNIFKRDNYYTENDDDQLEIGLNEDLDRLKMEFTPFYITRSANPSDAANKQIIREYIISKFNNFRMKTYKQPFSIASTSSNQVKKGANLFAYYPSNQRKLANKENRKPLGDRILVLGAHYGKRLLIQLYCSAKDRTKRFAKLILLFFCFCRHCRSVARHRRQCLRCGKSAGTSEAFV